MTLDALAAVVSGFAPQILRSAVIIVLGVVFARGLGRLLGSSISGRLGAHSGSLLERGLIYSAYLLILILVLHQFGFQLGALLGAAGVLGVAIGFASQTSFSNLISGLFLVAEQPFIIGDILEVDGVSGEVTEIGALSGKLRIFDNSVVRIPDELLLKDRFTNFTHFPLRRVDLQIGVAYKEDLERVRKALEETVREERLCLREPAPLFVHKGFGSSSIDLQISVWTEKENYLTTRNAMYARIKERFDRDGIEIPFPHVSLYAGEATKPFPVKGSPRP